MAFFFSAICRVTLPARSVHATISLSFMQTGNACKELNMSCLLLDTMNLLELLAALGLGAGEAKVYLALLKSGSSSAGDLSKLVALHRPNVYDYLQKLVDRGLAAYVVEHNVKKFRALDPEKLLELVDEKRMLVEEHLGDLRVLQDKHVDHITVDVYTGREGIKTFLTDVLRVGRDYVAFGVDEAVWEKDFSLLLKQHFRKEARKGFRARILTSKDCTLIFKHGIYRFIDSEFFFPTTTAVYGDRVCTVIWEPLTVIITRNSHHAEAQRRHFELLWKMATTRKPRDVRVIDC